MEQLWSFPSKKSQPILRVKDIQKEHRSVLHLVSNGAWHEELLVGEMAHPCHVNLIRVVQAFSHTAQVVQCHACVEPLRKMAIILLTGQWYAPSAIINDAWYCMV